MIPLAHRIAEHLPGWHVEIRHTDVVYLVRNDGARVHVRHDDGRITFHGCPPEYADGTRYYGGLHERRHEIECSATKTPKKLAREILTRLMVTYDPAYAVALRRVRQTTDYHRDAVQAAARLAGALGGQASAQKTPWSRADPRGRVGIVGHGVDAIGHVEVLPGYESRDHDGNVMHAEVTRVSFHVDGLDPETAAVLFAVLRDRQAAESEARVRVVEPVEVVEEDEVQAEEGRRRLAR